MGLPEVLPAALLYTKEEGTCRAPKGDYHNIDYFITSPGLETACRSPTTMATWPARPHKPLITYIKAKPK
eukprot:2935820-Pyramimonas_sp.AAC.1